jgi:hypothetical protein
MCILEIVSGNRSDRMPEGIGSPRLLSPFFPARNNANAAVRPPQGKAGTSPAVRSHADTTQMQARTIPPLLFASPFAGVGFHD